LHPLEAPGFAWRTEEPLDVRFYHKVVPPELELDGQPVNGVQCSHLRPVPIATAQEILLIDGWP
jgi:hypothetical protein